MVSPLDTLRKPYTVKSKGSKTNVMSWKSSVLVPETGYTAGLIGDTVMEGLAYSSSARKLYWSMAESASGAASGHLSSLSLIGATARFQQFTVLPGIHSFAALTSGIATAINCIAYSSALGLYIRGGAAGVIQTATTLAGPWTDRPRGSSETRAINFVFVAGSQIIVCTDSGGTNVLWRSTDGVNWTGVSTFGNAAHCVTWNGTRLVAVFESGAIRFSDDGGQTWSSSQVSVTGAVYSIVWTGSQFVAVGTRDSASVVYTSATANSGSFTRVNPGPAASLLSVCMSGSTIVAVGNSGTAMTSTNGSVWTNRTSAAEGQTGTGTAQTLRAFTANGLLYAVGGSGVCIVSADNGATWAAGPSTGVATTLRYGVSDPNSTTHALIVGDSGVMKTGEYALRLTAYASAGSRTAQTPTLGSADATYASQPAAMTVSGQISVTVSGLTPAIISAGLNFDVSRKLDGYSSAATRTAAVPETRVVSVTYNPGTNPAPYSAPVVQPNESGSPSVGTMAMLSGAVTPAGLFTLNAAGSNEGTDDSSRTVRGTFQPLTPKESTDYATTTKGSQAYWFRCDIDSDLKDAQSSAAERITFAGQDYEFALIERWDNAVLPHMKALCVSLKPFARAE